VLEREFGREAALVPDDGVDAPIRHRFRFFVEFGAEMILRIVTVHELHSLGGIDALVGRFPTEPDIEVDGIGVGFEIELLDVVDIGADNDLLGFRRGGGGCVDGRLRRLLGRCVVAPDAEKRENRERQ